jgi:hypothetical protein
MKLHKYFYELLILIIGVVLFLTNLTPGSYLTGWDNLQTDLNPLLGIKRAWFSAWQEYQSFGLAAGMGHAADLIRAVFVLLLSFITPQWLTRYLFTMLMIPVAGLGVYKLLELVGFTKEKRIFAFLGSLFYILNFCVIQMLYLPFEPFTVFFGLLPWELWIFLKVLRLEKPTARDWLLFATINLLATPQGVAQQLFVVYMMLLSLLGLGMLYLSKTKNTIKRGILAAGIILAINSFWLLPQAYFLYTNGSVVREAKINQLATSDVFYSNKDKGNLNDFLAFNGFFYDRLDMDQQPLFLTWKQHRETLSLQIVIYTLTAVVLVGLFAKLPYRVPFLLCFSLIALALLSNTLIFEQLNQLIRSNSFINQIFRSPFTKFAIPYALIASYFFAAGLLLLSSMLHRLPQARPYSLVLPVLAFVLLIIQAFPVFQGGYIAKRMKVAIPNEYFEAMEYFKTVDKNKRITLLPEYTLWGWFHTAWGYDGSGFIWYGIEQPIISRTFDVWSYKSESYFWEAKAALEAEDTVAFEKVLAKYAVDYILVDTSLRPIISNSKALQYDRITTMLRESKAAKLEKQWGFLSLYRMSHQQPSQNFVRASRNLPNIGPAFTITNQDSAYLENGDYVTNPDRTYDRYYPFIDLTTQTKLPKQQWSITETANTWVFTRPLDASLAEYYIPSSQINQVMIYNDDKVAEFAIPIAITNKGNRVEVVFPKVLINNFTPSTATPEYCQVKRGSVFSTADGKTLTIKTRNGGVGCVSFTNFQAAQQNGYLVKIRGEQLSGPSLFFYIQDLTKDQAYLEDRLIENSGYYVIAPRFEHGVGYAFTFQNASYQTIQSENRLDEVSVYLMPYDVLKQLSLIKSATPLQKASVAPVTSVKKSQYYRYDVAVDDVKPGTYLLLNQAYHQGWSAFAITDAFWAQTFPYLFGSRLDGHYMVNNWQNGWHIPDDASYQRIVLLYLPQYLQYAGIGMLVSTFLGVGIAVLSKKRRKNE